MRTIITLLGLVITQFTMAQIPTLKVKSEKPLKIVKMDIDITVVGNIATTNFDITFHNPNKRILEGELSMPLAEGQEISRYALEVNGHLREGVAIEKIKARQVYEAIVRQNIDPGIISKTKGNYFKTKIYPIPANGDKRVVIALTHTLYDDNGKLHYTLPMDTKQNIADFSLTVKVLKGQQKENIAEGTFENIHFDKKGDAYLLLFARKDYTPKEPLKFDIPLYRKNDYAIFTEKKGGKTYFYINYTPITLKKSLRSKSNNITIFWDKSFSADDRNIDTELNLLKKYLETGKSKTVTVVSFNYLQDSSKKFKIRNNATQLIDYLKSIKNDGATCFETLQPDKNTDEILFFSDGVNTIGKEILNLTNVPIYAITSSTGANFEWLKGLSKKTGGCLINLNKLSEKQALEQLAYKLATLPKCIFNTNSISEVYHSNGQIAGILKGEKGKITLLYDKRSTSNLIPLSFPLDKNGNTIQTFIINKDNTNAPIVRIWAGLKIQDLSMNYNQNKDIITAMGKEYNIVTRNTSFIVLDRVEDYITHKITPPKDLLADYNKALDEKEKEQNKKKDDILSENTDRLNKLKEWYKSPPKVEKESDKIPPPELTTFENNEIVEVEEEEEIAEDVVVTGYAPPAPSSRANKKLEDSTKSNMKTKVKVLAWLPDAPYLKALKESEDFDKTYFKYKDENKLRPSFYIEVANLLFQKGEKKKAVSVLSNILELDLENPELLKVAGHKLMQEKETSLALKIFEEIKELRPEEPQSYRDLAHAYEADKKYQKALGMYLHILNNRWGRFENIKDIIFNEMNRLISLHKPEIDTNIIPKEYIFDMPLDMRFTIDWTSNDNDIDLWVIEPTGAKCYYRHQNTQIGGKISKDFTAGYGPEEYSLKTKKRGTFTIYADYFGDRRQRITGPVTVYTRLYTNYGRADESVEVLTIQLKSKKETIQLGQAHSE